MLLPKLQDVQKAKTAERKIEIDNGVALARQIDSLRSTFAQERVAHEAWKKSSIGALNQQIASLDEELTSKKRELGFLDEQRQKLIEPLDVEWTRVNEQQALLEDKRQELYLDQERFKDKVKDLEEEKLKVGHSLKKAKQNEQRTEKSLEEAEEIKESAKNAYTQAFNFKTSQEVLWSNKQDTLDKTKKEYSVALKTIEIREQQVKDKESELLEREILLKDRQAMFERNKLR